MADGFSGFLPDNARSHLSNIPFSADLVLNRPIIAEPLEHEEAPKRLLLCSGMAPLVH